MGLGVQPAVWIVDPASDPVAIDYAFYGFGVIGDLIAGDVREIPLHDLYLLIIVCWAKRFDVALSMPKCPQCIVVNRPSD